MSSWDSLISDPGSVDTIIEEEENNNRSKNSSNLSDCMLIYLDKIRDTIKEKKIAPILCNPESDPGSAIEVGSRPDVSKFYLKRVIIVAPHLNFPKFKDEILCSTCQLTLHPNRFSNSVRTVHDLDGVCNVLLHNYICKNSNCVEHKKEVHAYTPNEGDGGPFKVKMPAYLRDLYGISLTAKSGVTSTLMQYIVDDALTSKSFYSTGEGIHSFRLQRFLQKKHNYLLYVKAYFDILKRKHQLQLIDDNRFNSLAREIEPFSKVHDENGYNEALVLIIAVLVIISAIVIIPAIVIITLVVII